MRFISVKYLLLPLTFMFSANTFRLLRISCSKGQTCLKSLLGVKEIVTSILHYNEGGHLSKQQQLFQEVREYASSVMRRSEDTDTNPPSQEHQLLQQLDGFCVIHKPIGWSSQDVVSKVRYIIAIGLRAKLGFKPPRIKVGHGGTLDPLAEGILVLGIGSATKQLASYMSGSKGYRAIAKLGMATDTLDGTGQKTDEKDASFVTTELLQQHIPRFQGEIDQIPPMFSALNKNGERLYDLARQGITVEREPRRVTVHSVQLTDTHIYTPPDMFSLEVECGGGVYIRSMISDLAESVGTIAHMTALVRTKSGQFTLEDCLKQEDWNFDKIAEHIQRCNHKAGLIA